MCSSPARWQRGTATVEFALVGVVFFLVLLSFIEISRGLFVWNGLTEVSRRVARLAAVCPINHSAIAKVAVFDEPSGAGESPIIHGLSATDVLVEYLGARGVVIGDPVGNFSDIRYVRGTISGYQHTFLIPFLDGPMTVSVPDFSTTVPRESLGIPREGVSAVCFGSAG